MDIVIHILVFAVVLSTALFLAQRETRATVIGLVMVGCVLAALKIWLFQQAPQWHDTLPDAATYEWNARAMVDHWAGEDVSMQSYGLRGLAGSEQRVWKAEDAVSYASVIGSNDWLYTAYVATWFWFTGGGTPEIIYSNAWLAGFLPAAAFGIALALGANRRLAIFAGAVAAFDPNAGANASWLLKDTLAAFLAMAALWGTLVYCAERRLVGLLVAVVSFGLVGVTRQVAFFAGLAALVLCAGNWLLRKEYRTSVVICVAAVCAIGVRFAILQLPVIVQPETTPGTIVNSMSSVLQGGIDILMADAGSQNADETTNHWRDALRTNFGFSIVKSVAHTLFAPYPWVALHPGMDWRSISELYYPGVLLWIAMLPGIAFCIVVMIRRLTPEAVVLLVFMGSLLLAYTVFHGEWSTRQRVFVLPAFWAIGVLGWSSLLAWSKSWQGVRASCS